MKFTGTVFKREEIELGAVECSISVGYLWCRLKVEGQTVIKFPLDSDTDIPVVAVRMSNIINQTGLVSNPVRVELTPVE